MCFCWFARVSRATVTRPFAARAWKYAVRTENSTCSSVARSLSRCESALACDDRHLERDCPKS